MKSQRLWNSQWKNLKQNLDEILNLKITRIAFKAFNEFININDKVILEAGCGTGRFSILLA